MTKKVKQKIASLLLTTQLFFSLLVPFTPFITPPSARAEDGSQSEAVYTQLQFSSQENGVDNQLHVQVSGSASETLDYSIYYLYEGLTQSIQGELMTGSENVIYIGTQSGDDFINHDWQRMIFKVEVDGKVRSYRLENQADSNEVLGGNEVTDDLELSFAESQWLIWTVDSDSKTAVTNQDVVLYQKYVFPLNEKVVVEFTRLPEETSSLTIREVVLSEELSEKYGTDVAFDITTEMENGEFEFDLSLPKSEVAEGDEVEVVYADSEEDLADDEKVRRVETERDGEQLVEVDEDAGVVRARKVDHMTVFVVKTPSPVSSDCSDAGFSVETGDQCYNTIQEAIDEASNGDEIRVSAGEYVEDGQIVIDKDLTIVGEDKETTIIKPAGDTGGSGDARGWFLVEDGVEFNLNNVTLDGEDKLISQAIRSFGSGLVEDNNIKNISYSQYVGIGIVVMGNENMTVKNNHFSNIARIGMMAFGPGVTNAIFEGNTYVGKGLGDWLDYAVEVGGGAKITISSNHISGCHGIASSDKSTSAGILATDYYGPGTEADIFGNTIVDNRYGIYVGYGLTDQSNVVVSRNNIIGNTEHGVMSSAPLIDATLNWWGDSTGPSGVGSGEGDSVSDNVIFQEWLCEEYPTAKQSVAGFCDMSHPQMSNIRMFVNDVESSLTKPGDEVRITAEVTDASGVDRVQIWVRKFPWNPDQKQLTSGQMTHVEDDTYEFTFQVPASYQDGSPLNEEENGNYFNFRPWDIHGNSQIGWRQNFTIDATAPSAPTGITIFDHEGNELGCNGYTNNRNIRIDWNNNPEEDIAYYRFDIKDKDDHVRPTNSHYEARIRNTDDYYKYRVWAVDHAGNISDESSGWCGVTLDREAPQAPTILFPNQGDYFNSTPILNNWSDVEDSSGIDFFRVEYEYDDGHTFSGMPYRTTSISQRNHTPGDWEQGGVKFRVQAFDNAGNEGAWSEWRHYYFDKTAPTITWLSPQPGQFLSGNVLIDLTCDGTPGDCQFINVWWWLSDSQDYNYAVANKQGHAFNELGTSYQWTLDTLAPTLADNSTGSQMDGVFTFRAEGEDLAGNPAQTNIELTIDNTAPSSELSVLADHHEHKGRTLENSWRGFQWFVEFVNVDLHLAGNYEDSDFINYAIIEPEQDCSGASYSVFSSTLANEVNSKSDGKHKLCYYAEDLAGNTEEPINEQLLKLDTERGQAAITSISGNEVDGVYYAQSPVTITAELQDEVSGVARTRLYIRDDNCSNTVKSILDDTVVGPGDVYTHSSTLSLDTGEYCVRVRGYDKAQNHTNVPTEHFVIDNEDPQGSIDYLYYSGADQSKDYFVTNDNTPTFEGTCSDNVGLQNVTLEVGGQTQEITCEDDSTWRSKPLETALDDGSYTVSLTLVDFAGNETLETEELTVDTVLPTAEHTYYVNEQEVQGSMAYIQSLDQLSFTAVYEDQDPSSGLNRDVPVIFSTPDFPKAYCGWSQFLNPAGGVVLDGSSSYSLNEHWALTSCTASLEEGEYFVRHRIFDNATRSTAPDYNQHRQYTGISFIVDNTTPQSTITFPENEGSFDTVYLNDWDGTIRGTATDPEEDGRPASGVEYVKVAIQEDADSQYWNSDDGIWQDGIYYNPTNPTADDFANWEFNNFTPVEGVYNISSHATDRAGNTEESYSITVVYDKTIPEVDISIDPVDPDGAGNWYITRPTATLTASDNFEVDYIQYRWGSDGSWNTYTTPLNAPSEGRNVLYYRAVDMAGNMSEEGIKNIRWDETDLTEGPLNVSADPNPTSGSTSTISWDKATDNVGIDHYKVTWDLRDGDDKHSKNVSSDTTEMTITDLEEGTYKVTVTAYDNSGHTKSASTDLVINRTAPAAPTLTLESTGEGTASLSWNEVEDADDYIILYGVESGAYTYAARVGNITEFTVEGLTAGSYYFVVRAVDNVDNQSSNSNEVSTGDILGTAFGTGVGGPAVGFEETGEVLGDETDEEPTQEEMERALAEAAEDGRVKGAAIDCAGWKTSLPWIVLGSQLLLLAAAELLLRHDTSAIKHVIAIGITIAAVASYYLLSNSDCYAVGSINMLANRLFWLVSLILSGLIRFLGYGFIEIVEGKR